MKDPHKTVERLTNALESMATGANAERRAQDIYMALCPLNPDEFPDIDARLLFSQIIASSGNGSGSQEECERLFANVWDLYWLMSSNSKYK